MAGGDYPDWVRVSQNSGAPMVPFGTIFNVGTTTLGPFKVDVWGGVALQCIALSGAGSIINMQANFFADQALTVPIRSINWNVSDGADMTEAIACIGPWMTVSYTVAAGPSPALMGVGVLPLAAVHRSTDLQPNPNYFYGGGIAVNFAAPTTIIVPRWSPGPAVLYASGQQPWIAIVASYDVAGALSGAQIGLNGNGATVGPLTGRLTLSRDQPKIILINMGAGIITMTAALTGEV